MAPIFSYAGLLAVIPLVLAAPAPAPTTEATRTFPHHPLGTGNHHHHHAPPSGEKAPFPIEQRKEVPEEKPEHFPTPSFPFPTGGFPFPTGGFPFPTGGFHRKHEHERRAEQTPKHRGHPQFLPTGGFPAPTGGFPAPTGGPFPPPPVHNAHEKRDVGNKKFKPHHRRPGAPLPTGGFFPPPPAESDQAAKRFEPHPHHHHNGTGATRLPPAPTSKPSFFVYE
ncbi:MAG: hypothetical protein Q9157_005194 [Trypethelium eluteriae]